MQFTQPPTGLVSQSSQIYARAILPSRLIQCDGINTENSICSFFSPSRPPSTVSTPNILLIGYSLKMSHFTTNLTIPESMKTPAFKLTAVGIMLFITATKPIHYSLDKDDPLTKPSNFYHLGIFILWSLAGFLAVTSCEWKLLRIQFIRWVRERVLRLQPERSSKIPPLEEDHPISFDALMLVPYAYSVVAVIDSILGTARGDQSEQRDVATIVARASFMWCYFALYGHTWRRDERSGVYIHPTDLRKIAWFILMGISGMAVLFSLIAGRRTFT
jgi:hypothetical protein